MAKFRDVVIALMVLSVEASADSSATATATQAEGRIAPPGTVGIGWEGLVGASPLEIYPIKLCERIDPPMTSRQARDPRANESVRSCYKAIENLAQYSQNSQEIKTLEERSARAAEAVVHCFTSVQSLPYWHTGFEPDTACAAYDRFIAADSGFVDSGRAPAGTRGGDRLREKLARNRKLQSDCVSQGKAALAANQKARSAAAATAALDVLRDIPPKERTAEESARVDAEIAACKAEATRRRWGPVMTKQGEWTDNMCRCKNKKCADQVQAEQTKWFEASSELKAVEASNDKMRRCKDQACADRVQAELEKWFEVRDREDHEPKPDEAWQEKMTNHRQRYAECLTKVMPAGSYNNETFASKTAKLVVYTDRVCKCKSKACATKEEAKFMSQIKLPDLPTREFEEKPSEADMAKFNETRRKLVGCLRPLTGHHYVDP